MEVLESQNVDDLFIWASAIPGLVTLHLFSLVSILDRDTRGEFLVTEVLPQLVMYLLLFLLHIDELKPGKDLDV